MNSGQIYAKAWQSDRALKLTWENGVIISSQPDSDLAAEEVWIAPALADLQINGYAGVDFQRDDLTEDDLLKAARALRTDGCARFLLTLITDEWSRLTARLRRLHRLRAESAELQAAIAGWHIEGPFLSSEPGFHGAHNPTLMLDPTGSHIQELRTITGSDPLLLTVAPERAGALQAIALATSLKMKVSLGHTNASVEILRQAVAAGATGFTHLGNGCPRELDRHDNILWRVLETRGLTVSLIPDQHHVSPALFRLIHRLLGRDSIYYTTDAMAAAGAPPGPYTLGALAVEVGTEQIVRQPGRTNFAGSALRPCEGVFRAAKMLNTSWQEVWGRFSLAPARLMGWDSQLKPGQPATFCLLSFGSDGQLSRLRTFSCGVEVGK